ncbi:lysosomal acid phosphatase-like [Diaphorina citri]|uniref:Lysosomal acid phosphatase-like n=1 Tax=Diaphorina citri TaxID=121845 RepID=A0A1S3CZU6_DIACI|nr:lysosomal acid phosphatase-like [Diaphorina citri]
MYRSESNQYTVKVKYLRSFNDETPQDISIPDCGSPCTLEKFIEISQYVIPEDWEQECRIHHSGERTDRSTVNQRRKR